MTLPRWPFRHFVGAKWSYFTWNNCLFCCDSIVIICVHTWSSHLSSCQAVHWNRGMWDGMVRSVTHTHTHTHTHIHKRKREWSDSIDVIGSNGTGNVTDKTWRSGAWNDFWLKHRSFAAGTCWVKRMESGKCKQPLARNVSKEDCCGAGPDVGFTEKELNQFEFFFATAIGDGATCSSCVG